MPVQKQVVVYAFRNKVNGKFYVGSTKDFRYRKSQHLQDLRKNRHHSPILQRAYHKYGAKQLFFEVIETVKDINTLLDREQHYIDTLRPEYNICSKVQAPPSRKGMKSTPEHCLHMSHALKGRPGVMKGKKFTKKHRKKISRALKGNQNCLGNEHSQATIEKMTRKRNENPSRRPKNPKEAQRKRSASLKKMWDSRPAEERDAIKEKIATSRSIVKETTCLSCGNAFEYHSCGKQIPKTCGNPECLSQLRRDILDKRRRADPEMDRRASQKRWARKVA